MLIVYIYITYQYEKIIIYSIDDNVPHLLSDLCEDTIFSDKPRSTVVGSQPFLFLKAVLGRL